MLHSLPAPYTSLDSNRMMVLYFCLSALDILGAVDSLMLEKTELINWIYRHQVFNRAGDPGSCASCGFIGGGFCGPFPDEGGPSKAHQAHISMTYTALCCLTILGDDLSRVKKDQVIASLRCLQSDNGCFQAVSFGSENDTRFLFCAVAISFILQDWSGINVDRAFEHLKASQAFDGGFGLNRGLEGHGGSTYCAVASLKLLGKLKDLGADCVESLERFCVNRQIGGFNGRVNKPADTCYTFWVGGSIKMLENQWLHAESTRPFLMTCQNGVMGGFSKVPGTLPDILHAHYSVCGMSLIGEPGFAEIVPELGLTLRTFKKSVFARACTANGDPLINLKYN